MKRPAPPIEPPATMDYRATPINHGRIIMTTFQSEWPNATHQVPGTCVAISSELVPGQLHVIVHRFAGEEALPLRILAAVNCIGFSVRLQFYTVSNPAWDGLYRPSSAQAKRFHEFGMMRSDR